MFRNLCDPSSGSVEREFLTFEFYTIKCISRPIKVFDFKNERWKPEISVFLGTTFFLKNFGKNAKSVRR